MRPPDCHDVTPSQLDTLRSLIIVHRRDWRATFRGVARHAGKPLTTTYTDLHALRGLGLATWEHGRTGTLRPLVYIVKVLG